MGSWQQNAGPSLAPSKLIPLVSGKARGEGAKLPPFGVDIPYRNQKEGAHFPPSRDYLLFHEPKWALKGLLQLSALPSGLQPKHLSCFCWSPVLGMLLLLLSLASFLKGPSTLSGAGPYNWRHADDVRGSKPGHPRTSGGEVSGSRSHPGTGLCCAAGRALGMCLSQHK